MLRSLVACLTQMLHQHVVYSVDVRGKVPIRMDPLVVLYLLHDAPREHGRDSPRRAIGIVHSVVVAARVHQEQRVIVSEARGQLRVRMQNIRASRFIKDHSEVTARS